MKRQNVEEETQESYTADPTGIRRNGTEDQKRELKRQKVDDNDYNVDDEYMPDINAILQWFRIDTLQFRTVPLKKYEKEM